MDKESMKFIAGGYSCATGGGTYTSQDGKTTFKYSSDAAHYDDESDTYTGKTMFGMTHANDKNNPTPVCEDATAVAMM